MSSARLFRHDADSCVPRFQPGTTVLLLYIDTSDQLGAAIDRIGRTAEHLAEAISEFESACGVPVGVVLCGTDGVSQAALRNPDSPAAVSLARDRAASVRKRIAEDRVAYVAFDSLIAGLAATDWRDRLSFSPSRRFASAALTSSYQVPESLFALVRAAKGDCLCLQFDADCLSDRERPTVC